MTTIVGSILVVFSLLILTQIVDVSAQTPKGSFESQAFTISNMSAIRQDSIYAQSWDILGIIKNISNKTLENIEVVAELYDSTNQLIDVVKGTPTFPNLAPGETSSFKVEYQTDSKNVTFDHYLIKMGITSDELGKFGQLLSLLNNTK
ncbi:MAG TPA: FxLYD domain-containing protein [Nitrososphaeraceae archaeon]|nr:FxLYD domain-containing protein [Nitrososphaeraceae archaeon]